MKFDTLGLPQDNGSTDLQDSARLAGLMTVFEWPQKIELGRYIREAYDHFGRPVSFIYVRHPLEKKYDFSRDQFICLAAGLWKQDASDMVSSDYITGRDILNPAVKGHIAKCQGRRSSWWQDLWLYGEVLTHAKLSPLGEPNQLLCMLMVADKKYLRLWVRLNPQWKQSILNYWCEKDGAWRGEPELANHMIQKITTHIGS